MTNVENMGTTYMHAIFGLILAMMAHPQHVAVRRFDRAYDATSYPTPYVLITQQAGWVLK
jgi:hypothetical protein